MVCGLSELLSVAEVVWTTGVPVELMVVLSELAVTGIDVDLWLVTEGVSERCEVEVDVLSVENEFLVCVMALVV